MGGSPTLPTLHTLHTLHTRHTLRTLRTLHVLQGSDQQVNIPGGLQKKLIKAAGQLTVGNGEALSAVAKLFQLAMKEACELSPAAHVT